MVIMWAWRCPRSKTTNLKSKPSSPSVVYKRVGPMIAAFCKSFYLCIFSRVAVACKITDDQPPCACSHERVCCSQHNLVTLDFVTSQHIQWSYYVGRCAYCCFLCCPTTQSKYQREPGRPFLKPLPFRARTAQPTPLFLNEDVLIPPTDSLCSETNKIRRTSRDNSLNLRWVSTEFCGTKMGGGISVIPPEKSEKLTPHSLQQFYEFEAECEGRDLTPCDTYMLLNAKYEELIKADNDYVALLSTLSPLTSPKNNNEVNEFRERRNTHEGIAVPEPPRQQLTRKGSVFNILRRSLFPVDYYLEHDNADNETLAKEIAKAIEEINRLELQPINDAKIEEMVKTLFKVREQKQLDELAKTRPKPRSFDDSSTHFCKLCNLGFDTNYLLTTHVLHSEMHEAALKARERRIALACEEGERLTKLAKSTISMLLKAPPKPYVRPRTQAETKEEMESKARVEVWKRAIRRVITTKLTGKYELLVEQIFVTSRDVKQLFAEFKYFPNQRVTYDIRVYCHTLTDTFEIIPHLLPQQVARDDDAQCNCAIARSSVIIPAPRIYLSREYILSTVLGVSAAVGTATGHYTWQYLEESKAGAAQHHLSGLKDAEVDRHIETAMASYIRKRLKVKKYRTQTQCTLYFDTAPEQPAAIASNNNANNTNSSSSAKERFIDSIKVPGATSSSAPLASISEDREDSMRSRSGSRSGSRRGSGANLVQLPVLERPPATLVPVPVDMQKIQGAWETKQKLQHLHMNR